MNDKKCIVFGCSNKQNQGKFVGDICAPCYEYITTGKVGCTDSFLRKFNEYIEAPVNNSIAIVDEKEMNMALSICNRNKILKDGIIQCIFNRAGGSKTLGWKESGYMFIPFKDKYIRWEFNV